MSNSLKSWTLKPKNNGRSPAADFGVAEVAGREFLIVCVVSFSSGQNTELRAKSLDLVRLPAEYIPTPLHARSTTLLRLILVTRTGQSQGTEAPDAINCRVHSLRMRTHMLLLSFASTAAQRHLRIRAPQAPCRFFFFCSTDVELTLN